MRAACAIAVLVAAAVASARAAEPEVDFEQQVLPLLKAHCFQCHDGRKKMSGLRLDIRESALAGGDSAMPAVVPGKPDESELIQRILAEDEGYRMPPEGERLSAEQIATLQAWVASGAPWPDHLAGSEAAPEEHWAFQAPQKAPLPDAQDAPWVRTPIDAFVLARLEQEGLQPSPEADRVTLVRRLYLDLIGLPPTIDQVDAFLADTRPGAYSRLVDRLLESPHYGERWGRIWLDNARYADSDGYEKDKSREVWFYRDWVIQALNDDMPYDQFIIRQIAGDLLPGATQDDRVATGFLRNSMTNEEGGVDPEQFRMVAMFDRMEAIGKAVLGLTIQCAQCHDHKYDPLTQEEYYRMFAFLNDSHEANIAVYTPSEQKKRAEIFGKIEAIQADLRHRHPDWRERMAAWEERVRGDQPEWTVVVPDVDEDSTGGQRYIPMPDGSFLAQGYAPTKHTVKLTVDVPMERITSVQLELLTDPNLPLGGPGRSIFGTAALTEFSLEAAPLDHPDERKEVKIASATADFNPPRRPLDKVFDDRSKRERVTGPIELAIDGVDETAWGTDAGPGRRNQPRKAVFRLAEPIEFPGGARLVFYLKQNHGGWNSDDNQNHNLGRFRLSVTGAADASADPLSPRVRQLVERGPDGRTEAETAAVFAFWRTTVPEWELENRQIEELWSQHPEGSSQLVYQQRTTPRPTFILERGDFLHPEEEVQPGTPAFLHPMDEDAPRDRLGFAQWLVDRDSPTTARAIVNRVWQAYFGIGLVATSEDLGMQAEPPSHPQLLDWLAVDLMDHGWSLKHLHRMIVHSSTYRQASRVRDELLERDPYNRLLARGARFRVDAELVRDIALCASGLLNPRVGGPSVYPPLPAFMLKPPVSYGPKVWYEDLGEDRYRRALYTFRYRSVPYPILQAFDAPNGDFACVRRARSNTPLQALATLNEPISIECAQALGRRILREGGNADSERITSAFRWCLARHPTSDEQALLLDLLEQHRRLYQEHPDDAQRLARPDLERLGPLPSQADSAELAAWTTLARVLLNLDETITRE